MPRWCGPAWACRLPAPGWTTRPRQQPCGAPSTRPSTVCRCCRTCHWTTGTRRLSAVAGSDRIHGSVAGRATRLLLDAGLVDGTRSAPGSAAGCPSPTPAPEAAAWLDGFLSGDAVLLIHDRRLLRIVDDWVAGVEDDIFDDVLPLLRRTFSEFSRPERREIGEQVSRGRGPSQGPDAADAGPGRPRAPQSARWHGSSGWEAIA